MINIIHNLVVYNNSSSNAGISYTSASGKKNNSQKYNPKIGSVNGGNSQINQQADKLDTDIDDDNDDDDDDGFIDSDLMNTNDSSLYITSRNNKHDSYDNADNDDKYDTDSKYDTDNKYANGSNESTKNNDKKDKKAISSVPYKKQPIKKNQSDNKLAYNTNNNIDYGKCKNCEKYLDSMSEAQKKISLQDDEIKHWLEQHSVEKEQRLELEFVLDNNKSLQKELNNSLNQEKKYNSTLKNQLNKSNQEKLLLNNKNDNLSNQIQLMIGDMNILQQKITNLKKRIKNLNIESANEKDKLTSIIAEKDKIYNKNKKTINSLRRQLGSIKIELQTLKATKENLQNELSNMVEQNSKTLIQMQNDFHEQSKSDQNKISDLVVNLEVSYGEIAKLNCVNSKLDKKNTLLKKENQKLKDMLENQKINAIKNQKKTSNSKMQINGNKPKEDPLDKFFHKSDKNND